MYFVYNKTKFNVKISIMQSNKFSCVISVMKIQAAKITFLAVIKARNAKNRYLQDFIFSLFS